LASSHPQPKLGLRLLTQCDLNAALDPEGVEFMNMPSVGRENIE
jgi:hypothetical protein